MEGWATPTGGVVNASWPYPGENTYYVGASSDPVRPNTPYTPVTLVDPTRGPTVPLVGVLVLVVALLLFEHMRKGR